MIPGGRCPTAPRVIARMPQARPMASPGVASWPLAGSAHMCVSFARWMSALEQPCTLMELCAHTPMGSWAVGGRCGPSGRVLADSPHPWAANALLLAVQNLLLVSNTPQQPRARRLPVV